MKMSDQGRDYWLLRLTLAVLLLGSAVGRSVAKGGPEEQVLWLVSLGTSGPVKVVECISGPLSVVEVLLTVAVFSNGAWVRAMRIIALLNCSAAAGGVLFPAALLGAFGSGLGRAVGGVWGSAGVAAFTTLAAVYGLTQLPQEVRTSDQQNKSDGPERHWFAVVCCAAACMCGNVGCATELGNSHGQWHVKTECPGGTVLRVPVRVLGTRSGVGSGRSHWVAEGASENPRAQALLSFGSRGSPVYDSNGTLVGLVDRVYGERCRGVIGICEIQDDCEQEGSRWAKQQADLDGLVPGSSVEVLVAWGDIRVGTLATVYSALGSEVRFLHEQSSGAVPADGTAAFALARAPVIGLGEDGEGLRRVCGSGEIIGAVTELSRSRGVAVVGKIPKSVCLQIRAVCANRWTRKWTVNVACHPTRTPGWCGMCVRAILDLVPSPVPKKARIYVRRSGSEDALSSPFLVEFKRLGEVTAAKVAEAAKGLSESSDTVLFVECQVDEE